MGNSSLGACKQSNRLRIKLYTVGMPYIWASPSQLLSILSWSHTKLFQAECNIFIILCQMRVHHDAFIASQYSRITHQVLDHQNGEQGATPTRSIDPWLGSLNASITLIILSKIACSPLTKLSGGKPPSLSPILMAPRVG